GRHEPNITFELRLASTDEQNPAFGRTVYNRPVASVYSNTPPTVTAPTATTPRGSGCGSPNKPVSAYRNVSLTATAGEVAASYVTGQFALWPAQPPDQRTTVYGTVYGASTLRADPDLSAYADKTVVAWSARSYDQEDYSAWTKPCYLLMDRSAPSKAPW